MVVFLALEFQNQAQGTLEIDHLDWPGGEVSDNWEWMGGPEASDGGTWEWGYHYGSPCMELTSNLSSRLVGKVLSSKWNNGPVPPNTPWFSPKGDETDKFFRYHGTDGIYYFYFWELQ